jgi:hypothetical protein
MSGAPELVCDDDIPISCLHVPFPAQFSALTMATSLTTILKFL